jgi:hypothetical protein
MRHPLPFVVAILSAALVPLRAAPPSPPSPISARAESLLERLLEPASPSAPAFSLHPPRWVAQKPGQRWAPEIPPVWEIRFTFGSLGAGYLFLSGDGELRLEEFAFDLPHPVPPLNGGWIRGIPNLQQFPVPSPSGKGQTASGCVPTSAASLVGFWAARVFPHWLPQRPASAAPLPQQAGTPPEDSDLRAFTLRLREKMRMIEIPDKEGYADGSLSLSGALPSDAATALQKTAQEQQVAVHVSESEFSVSQLRTEIGAGRPVLVSCTVRLPHKPDLAWGHEMVAAGFQQVEDFDYVGVVDNFMPLKNASTLRWIEKSAFHSAICVCPEGNERKRADQKKTP